MREQIIEYLKKEYNKTGGFPWVSEMQIKINLGIEHCKEAERMAIEGIIEKRESINLKIYKTL